MNKKLLNKKGLISINYVILIFVSTIIILGFMNIMQKTLSINEIQGNLDMAGVIALRTGLDETRWRLEELVIDESLARKKFREVIDTHVKTGNLLRDFEITELNIYPPNHPGLKSLGIDSGIRDQYFIESVAIAKYKSQPVVDLVAFHAINYFDFFHTNEFATKTISGSKHDGNMEVIVRSVSRLVLR